MKIADTKTIERYYKALVDREPSFVGLFFVGVKTTSVFCIATCRARKPKFENVEFYTSFKEAMDYGYRPCKICKPTENSQEAPVEVQEAIALVRNSPKEKIADWQLRELSLSPTRIRRWFKQHYGMTFHAFQRMYRINNALIELRSGKKMTDVPHEAGYDSLSGFSYTYKKLMGNSPAAQFNSEPILISRLTSPLGPLFVCATENGICLLEFVDRKMLETEFKEIQQKLKRRLIIGENKHIVQAKNELSEYFARKRKVFDLAIDAPGTEFQHKVWKQLQSVLYGSTSSYEGLAESLGAKTATRAVARANGYNRIAIVIPCHRIIGKDGALRGYGGGLDRKRWLLDLEKEGLKD
ncbi:methylated-DNA--[protein]-cysteine S-methyltransferase [Chitinophagales bacterium]|nr:methylated-DNA--[protein]-cysteine S-methyltransferase [Chitinophagales bacterium]